MSLFVHALTDLSEDILLYDNLPMPVSSKT